MTKLHMKKSMIERVNRIFIFSETGDSGSLLVKTD